ncbi:hypothetical protein JY651_47395 [Pyxidicoccus parkwayensis]|uniref:Uncharacterized protein n=1 Tax=Pyxidicoccus parkwayensis TaxID=2813578 RepID=A0ABX7NZ32_9BACT|nr:hypothetical protein [Pyxidicoccus parkwaysis]QSQ22651.1 hypothetical protein JY651_47395 [Pyxidicoccus parkwaysis]
MKRLLVGTSMLMGLGVGFVAGARPAPQVSQEPSSWTCSFNFQCDRGCGGPGCGICAPDGKCWCGCAE